MATMVRLGTTAPDGSLAMPAMDPVTFCESATPSPRHVKATAARIMLRVDFMQPPSSFGQTRSVHQMRAGCTRRGPWSNRLRDDARNVVGKPPIKPAQPRVFPRYFRMSSVADELLKCPPYF